MPQQHNTSSETRCSIVAALDLTPTRPKSDKKLYRLIHLDNGLEVCACYAAFSAAQLIWLRCVRRRCLSRRRNSTEKTWKASAAKRIIARLQHDIDCVVVACMYRMLAARNSAAGLAVNVGSFEDPLEAQGLAHFLEHSELLAQKHNTAKIALLDLCFCLCSAVVFMGSEKYPRENAYDEFVSENGGSSNAWTDAEATVFHFDVLPEAFPKALDIFAQCLATPRLSPVRFGNSLFPQALPRQAHLPCAMASAHQDACDRELQAIENEFQIALMSDPSRLQVQCRRNASCLLFCRRSNLELDAVWLSQQLWAHTSKPEHPMSKFSWGNLNSLKLVPVRSSTRRFELLCRLRPHGTCGNICAGG